MFQTILIKIQQAVWLYYLAQSVAKLIEKILHSNYRRFIRIGCFGMIIFILFSCGLPFFLVLGR